MKFAGEIKKYVFFFIVAWDVSRRVALIPPLSRDSNKHGRLSQEVYNLNGQIH